MTNLIQNAFAARPNQVDASIEKLEGGQRANTERIAQLKQKCTELEQSVTSLQQDHDELAEKHSRAEAELRAQLDDQETEEFLGSHGSQRELKVTMLLQNGYHRYWVSPTRQRSRERTARSGGDHRRADHHEPLSLNFSATRTPSKY